MQQNLIKLNFPTSNGYKFVEKTKFAIQSGQFLTHTNREIVFVILLESFVF